MKSRAVSTRALRRSEPVSPRRWLRQVAWEVPLVAALAGLVFVVHDVGWVLDQPFWHDESWVAVSTRMPLGDVFESTYTTPIGFTLLLRAVAWGGEEGLRLLPLVFSAGSVVAAYCLARLLAWRDRRQAVLAGVLAAGAALLVPSALYRNDLKQYTAEAFAALSVLALTANVERRWSRRSLVLLAAGVVVAKLISHTVVFVGAAAFASLTLIAVAERRWQRVRESLFAGTASAVGVLTVYLALDRRAATPRLREWWERLNAFPPTGKGLSGVLDYMSDRTHPLELRMGFGGTWLTLSLIGAGLVTLVLARRRAVALAVVVLLLELVAAGVAHRYPLLDLRTSHFLLVTLAVIAAIGVAGLAALARPASFVASLAVAAVAAGLYVNHSKAYLDGHTSIIPVDTADQVKYVAENRHPGDAILVNVLANFGFGYYWPEDQPRATPTPRWLPAFGVKYPASSRIVVVPGSSHPDAQASFHRARQLALAGSGRIWLVREIYSLSKPDILSLLRQTTRSSADTQLIAPVLEVSLWARALRGYVVHQVRSLLLVSALSKEQLRHATLERADGHPVITLWRGRHIRVVPGLRGSVDKVSASNGRLRVLGWAADTDRHLPADWVLVFSGGRLLGADLPATERPDVAKAWGGRLGPSGFELSIRAEHPERLADRSRLRAFAVVGDRASEIPLSKAGAARQAHD